jgi:hypothetical protein
MSETFPISTRTTLSHRLPWHSASVMDSVVSGLDETAQAKLVGCHMARPRNGSGMLPHLNPDSGHCLSRVQDIQEFHVSQDIRADSKGLGYPDIRVSPDNIRVSLDIRLEISPDIRVNTDFRVSPDVRVIPDIRRIIRVSPNIKIIQDFRVQSQPLTQSDSKDFRVSPDFLVGAGHGATSRPKTQRAWAGSRRKRLETRTGPRCGRYWAMSALLVDPSCPHYPVSTIFIFAFPDKRLCIVVLMQP